jgi:hypothetical protein
MNKGGNIQCFRPCSFGFAHKRTTIPNTSPKTKKFVLQPIGGEGGKQAVSPCVLAIFSPHSLNFDVYLMLKVIKRSSTKGYGKVTAVERSTEKICFPLLSIETGLYRGRV